MIAKDKNNFAEILTGMAELYGKKFSPALLQLYWFSLSCYSIHQVMKALQWHVVNPDCGQFMPKPADVVRYIEGESETQALNAWNKAIQSAKHIGAYDTIVFDDPLIHIVINDMGGWVRFCHTPEKDLPFRLQEFSRRYRAVLPHPPKDYPSKLIGVHEHRCQLDGYDCPAPTLYGDVQKAKAVLQKLSVVKNLDNPLSSFKSLTEQ